MNKNHIKLVLPSSISVPQPIQNCDWRKQHSPTQMMMRRLFKITVLTKGVQYRNDRKQVKIFCNYLQFATCDGSI